MKSSLLLVAILATAACSKKENKNEAPATSGTPVSKPSVPGPSEPAPPPAMSKLTCAKVVTPAMRDTYFKGAKETETIRPVGVECMYLTTEPEVSVSMLVWDCGPGGSSKTAPEDGKKRSQGATDLPGVGRGAYQTTTRMGRTADTDMVVTQAWDDDSPCYVTINAKDGAAIAKDTLAAVTADSLK